jgi:LysR family transcriptional regulator, regulator for metE and metH
VTDTRHRLELRHLRLLVAIVDAGGLTRAGRTLHLTQSALSHQLRDAEERLGTPLFHRIRKRLVLTPAGERMVPTARRLLGELRRAEDGLQRPPRERGPSLRLGLECTTAYHWLPPLLERYRRAHPDVRLSLHPELAAHPVDALRERRLDVALLTCVDHASGLSLRPLFEDEDLLLLAPTHRLADRDAISPGDLRDETLILAPPGDEAYLVRAVLGPAGARPRSVVELPLTGTMLDLAAAGAGVCFVPGWTALPWLESGRLIARPLEARGRCRRWQAATLPDAAARGHVAAFVRLLAEELPATHPTTCGIGPGGEPAGA